ncbi:low molecular weight phosphatase family protein [Bryobacter aggregatus]|uniref:arsenate-mycothiol transferase ArsC n=1 Tax=Bryobacter aggregatus TaxID=360054 RepID=UPI00068DB0E3|nr:arsenate reductase ArsC [Bryobacter aggregatus]
MKTRVLFLCVGNSCRSQMAEGFARAYGHDCIEAVSAGLSPAMIIDPNTKAVMQERSISLDEQFPKPIELAMKPPPALIINMSGAPLPHFAAGIPTESWRVRDPIGEVQAVHREVRDQIESAIMALILRLRQNKPAPSPSTPPKRFKFGRMA